MFSYLSKTNRIIPASQTLSSAIAFSLSHSKMFLFGKGLSDVFLSITQQGDAFNSTTQSRLLTALYKKPLENIVRKGENAWNQHFLLFRQCFLPFSEQISNFQLHLFCRLQVLSIWTSLKFLSLGKELSPLLPGYNSNVPVFSQVSFNIMALS